MQAVYDRLTALALLNLGKRVGGAVGGPFIDIIVQLIPVLLPMLLQCFQPKPAAAQAANPGLIVRWHLRRELEKAVPGNDLDSIMLRGHVFDALLATGKTVTEEDMAAIAA